MAIVVVDPDPARAPLAAPALRMLDELGIPHLLFVNRIDQAHGRIRDLLSALQPISVEPLIARQIPIREGDKVTGFVDLALERAYHYQPGKAYERIDIPGDLQRGETRYASVFTYISYHLLFTQDPGSGHPRRAQCFPTMT